MTSKELLDIYDRLNIKGGSLLTKIADFGDYISRLSLKICFIGFFTILVFPLGDVEGLSDISLLIIMTMLIIFPMISMCIGKELRIFITDSLSYNEIQFIRTIELLKDIEEYKEADNLGKESIKRRISKNIDIIFACIHHSRAWENKNGGVSTLKKNLKYNIILNIDQGDEESINRVCVIIEKIAVYIIDPKTSLDSFLDELNNSTPDMGQIAFGDIPILHIFSNSYINYTIICIAFSYLVIKIFSVSIDTALLAGVTLYTALIIIKKN